VAARLRRHRRVGEIACCGEHASSSDLPVSDLDAAPAGHPAGPPGDGAASVVNPMSAASSGS